MNLVFLKMAASESGSQFTEDIKTKLIDIFSRYGCREVPRPCNFTQLITDIAQFEMTIKPSAIITMIHDGVPNHLKSFFQGMTVPELHNLVQDLTVSRERILSLLTPNEFENPSQERTFNYLQQYLYSASIAELAHFLRYATGSTAPTTKISISFCNISGLARRPTSHTCSGELVLPVSYKSQQDFTQEFTTVTILNSEYAWIMDAV